jgi:hypothetical protein
MRYRHVRVVLMCIGWLSSGAINALAFDTPLALLNSPSAATATVTHPGEAPTPQFLRVTIGLEAGSRTIRMHTDPAWVALHRPYVRIGPAPIKHAPAADVAPLPQGGGDALRQMLEQALARAQPAAVPSP